MQFQRLSFLHILDELGICDGVSANLQKISGFLQANLVRIRTRF